MNENLPLIMFLIVVIPVTGLIILQKIIELRREKHIEVYVAQEIFDGRIIENQTETSMICLRAELKRNNKN